MWGKLIIDYKKRFMSNCTNHGFLLKIYVWTNLTRFWLMKIKLFKCGSGGT